MTPSKFTYLRSRALTIAITSSTQEAVGFLEDNGVFPTPEMIREIGFIANFWSVKK